MVFIRELASRPFCHHLICLLLVLACSVTSTLFNTVLLLDIEYMNLGTDVCYKYSVGVQASNSSDFYVQEHSDAPICSYFQSCIS